MFNISIENYREQPSTGNIAAIFDVYDSQSTARYRNLKLIRGKKGRFLAFPSFAEEGLDGRKRFIPYYELIPERQKEFVRCIENELKNFISSNERVPF